MTELWPSVSSASNTRSANTNQTRELLNVTMHLRNPRRRFTTTRHPPINLAFAIAEIIWIVRGRRDVQFLIPWNSQLPNFIGITSSTPGAYGFRLRKQFGVDQFSQIYRVLSNNPQSRQAVLQIWDSRTDLPDENGTPSSADIPCSITSMIKISDGRLNWTQIMRSNDIIMGLPYNLIQWTLLQEILAGWLNVEMGTYTHFSDSLHLYSRDEKKYDYRSKAARGRVEEVPDLRLSITESDQVFKTLESATEAISIEMKPSSVHKIMQSVGIPSAYQPLIAVIAAERIRRLGFPNLATEIIDEETKGDLQTCAHNWNKGPRKP